MCFERERLRETHRVVRARGVFFSCDFVDFVMNVKKVPCDPFEEPTAYI